QNKSIPAELETIAIKALEKNPADRYGTAQEMAEDLYRFILDEPIRARRPSLRRRVTAWCRRHMSLVSGVAAVGLTAVLLGGIALWHSAATAQAVAEDLRKAAAAEKQAKELAQAQEAETKAVLEFVEKRVFAAARPEGLDGGLGHDVTLRRAIEGALPFI